MQKLHKTRSPEMQQLFIVGCPRSGTTLLQSLLAAHPEITSFPETQFFLHLWGEDLSRTLHERLTQFFCEDIARPELLETMQPYQTVVDRVAWFVGILDRLATEEGNNIWLEKTPQHLFFIEDILRHLPEAKFIHITREPLNTIASLYLATRMPAQRRSWGEPWSLEKCVTLWKQSARATEIWANNPQHSIVKYEDLCASPDQELTKCCEFIGAEFSPEMLFSYKSEALKLSLGLPWHDRVDRDIVPDNPDKYKNVFQSWEVDYINHRLI
jgi:Sulfotransferase family